MSSSTDWDDLSARASFASHRLIGWIYWDPLAQASYRRLGLQDGGVSYVVSRSAPLAPAGHQAVAAAFYSISPLFIEISLALANDCTTLEAVARARDQAVGHGLRQHVPEICAGLAELGPALWEALDDLRRRGLADEDGVNAAGLELRRSIEVRTDRLTQRAWRLLGATRTEQLLALVEPVGPRLLARIDETAGPEWMPAARERRATA
jgi:hypothetical protein